MLAGSEVTHLSLSHARELIAARRPPASASGAEPACLALGRAGRPAAALLARGGVLAIPTESSYGLGADPRNPAGVEAVYRIKGRDAGKPLPVVVAGLEQLAGLGIDPGLPILDVSPRSGRRR